MLLKFLFLFAVGVLLSKFIFRKLSFSQRFLVIFGIGVVISAYDIKSFIENKSPNIYQQLNIGRMMSTKEILKLIKIDSELYEYYEDIQRETYELKCLSLNNTSWLSESFAFYGQWILAINVLSFTQPLPSRLILLVMFGSLAIEFMIYLKKITLTFLIFTSCEQVVLLRSSIYGISFIIFFIGYLREINNKEKIQKFNRELISGDQDVERLNELLGRHELSEYFQVTDLLEKIIDKEAKDSAPPSKMKKIIKILAVGLILSSFISLG
ncbi:hypothetical protein SteCoe_12484 [Stentor coeruleus]|uniref:Uncharacterized protein n=1 Tax=Stentor coeruleus TaxID=5963 RepID=A0A1R2CAQ8_9CILI|nr:hypothetical protein SteCoe_12484 [Stentor coeruleus]